MIGLTQASARGDGCKYLSDGRLVPERGQRAFIEWSGGIETLHVAAKSDATDQSSVWIVPIRAAAKQVHAEPVERFPIVAYYETVRSRAAVQLRQWIAAAGLLDSAGLCCPIFFVGCSGNAPPAKDREASRVEKLGMIVTVVSASSKLELQGYLKEQGVNWKAANLQSLLPYFDSQDYLFVCGWVAKQGEPAQATAMRIEFPTPHVWFPLRPTQAYSEAVETQVFVRGFVRPNEGLNLPELNCEYVYGVLADMNVTQSFTSALPKSVYDYYSSDMERLTLVTVSTDPSRWNQDLELVEGTNAIGTVSLVISGWAGRLGMLWSAMLGAAIGLLIPRVVVVRAERNAADRWVGILIGASIAASILSSLVVFIVYRWRLRPTMPRHFMYLTLFGLACLHFAIVAAFCQGVINWLAPVYY